MEKLTKGLEKYLSAIYLLSLENKKITPKNIGKITGHNPASVLEFVKNLQKKELIEYKPYKGINLTEKGRKTADKLRKKREIILNFLNKFLLLEGDELVLETENLQYDIDDSLLQRFNYFLDFISFCPASLPNWFEGIKSYVVSGEMTEKCSNCIEAYTENGLQAKCKNC